MPDVCVSKCRTVTAGEIAEPGQLDDIDDRSVQTQPPLIDQLQRRTAVNNLVIDAVSNRVVRVTGTAHRRDAHPTCAITRSCREADELNDHAQSGCV
jgi:hypothetical protein